MKQAGFANIRLVEKNSKLNLGGLVVILRANGYYCLEKLGLLTDELNKHGSNCSRINEMTMFDHTGDRWGYIPHTIKSISKLNPTYSATCIFRRDLIDILYNKAGELNIDVEFNKN